MQNAGTKFRQVREIDVKKPCVMLPRELNWHAFDNDRD